jgi:hypothetical protein
MSQTDLIVYRARDLSKVVAREVERLRKELGLTVHVVSYAINGDAESGEHFTYSKQTLSQLPYTRQLDGIDWNTMIGRHDRPIIWHRMRFPHFERYWVIEDDVRYSGDWRELFDDLDRSEADLLMTTIQALEENPTWGWWKSLLSPTGEPSLALKGFGPFCRLSGRLLAALDAAYRDGWRGHFEATWPTVAAANKLLVEDVGGRGSFTPAARYGRHYWNTPGPYSLFPGSFVYHPWFMDMGESQFMRLSPGPHLLWHPVKSK